MENILELICEILKTYNVVLCSDTRDWLQRGNMKVYKDIIPIYLQSVNNINELNDYCSEDKFRCGKFPRCACTTNIEILKFKKINDTMYDITVFDYGDRSCEGDVFDHTIEKINGKWYMNGAWDTYELFI